MKEFIKYKDIEFLIEFDYYKSELPENYNDGSGYSGSNDMIDIYSIKFNGIEFYDIFEKCVIEFEELILNKINIHDRS